MLLRRLCLCAAVILGSGFFGESVQAQKTAPVNQNFSPGNLDKIVGMVTKTAPSIWGVPAGVVQTSVPGIVVVTFSPVNFNSDITGGVAAELEGIDPISDGETYSQTLAAKPEFRNALWFTTSAWSTSGGKIRLLAARVVGAKDGQPFNYLVPGLRTVETAGEFWRWESALYSRVYQSTSYSALMAQDLLTDMNLFTSLTEDDSVILAWDHVMTSIMPGSCAAESVLPDKCEACCNARTLEAKNGCQAATGIAGLIGTFGGAAACALIPVAGEIPIVPKFCAGIGALGIGYIANRICTNGIEDGDQICKAECGLSLVLLFQFPYR